MPVAPKLAARLRSRNPRRLLVAKGPRPLA